MIVGGFQAIMNAICPAVFTTSASDKIKILYDKVSKRLEVILKMLLLLAQE